MSKLSNVNSDHTVMEAIVAMSEGNPGAVLCILKMGQVMSMVELMLMLDAIGLYGAKIYMLWNDCCDRDSDKMINVLEALRTGKLSSEDIHKNLAEGRGTPFEGL